MGYYRYKNDWTNISVKYEDKDRLEEYKDSLGCGTSYREAINTLLDEHYDENE